MHRWRWRPRLAPFNTPLYRYCKPQIKLENAAAAGLPAVATDCPASTSLHPDVVTVPADFSVDELAAAMQRAVDGPGLGPPYTSDDYLRSMATVLERPSRVVYTAIFGGYDELVWPPCARPSPNMSALPTTALRSRGWEIRYCHPSGDPVFQAKRIKVLAHETLQCSTSLWVDARVELGDLHGIFDRFDSELALQQHPQRNCLYEEAEFSKQIGRGDPQRIDQTVARFRAAGHPERAGLWLGGIVLRRHTPATRAFNREWWRQVNIGTLRDQIILPVLLQHDHSLRDTAEGYSAISSRQTCRANLDMRGRRGMRAADERVVYTAIFGDYDELREPRRPASGVQFICFTDNPPLRSRAWNIRYCRSEGDPLFQAKRFKCLAHEALRCKHSLWIDGRIQLHGLRGVFERGHCDLALQPHPDRRCIYEEAAHCKRIGRGDPQRIDQAVAHFRAAGHAERAGLWWTGVILRRHSKATRAFNEAWWQELVRGTSRDQISLPVVRQRLGTKLVDLPRGCPQVHVGYHVYTYRFP